MAITYKPKIIPVLNNSCYQTIRTMRKKEIKPLDSIKFHGWLGRPYRSKWSWVKDVIVRQVFPIQICKSGIYRDNEFYSWDSEQCNLLAKLDYIEPATGEELRDVLFGLNKTSTERIDCQIIRW